MSCSRFDPGQLNAAQKHRLLEKLNLGMAIGHGGCHIWSRAVSGSGYPQMKLGKEIDSILTPGTSYPYYAHHIAYSLANNIKLNSPGLEISHLCNIKYCINPNHLSHETRATNLQRCACHAQGLCTGHTGYTDCMFF